jgi:hypothetical protein
MDKKQVFLALLKPSFSWCFAPATAATPMAISLKNVCLTSLSLKEYPGFQQSRFFTN